LCIIQCQCLLFDIPTQMQGILLSVPMLKFPYTKMQHFFLTLVSPFTLCSIKHSEVTH